MPVIAVPLFIPSLCLSISSVLLSSPALTPCFYSPSLTEVISPGRRSSLAMEIDSTHPSGFADCHQLWQQLCHSEQRFLQPRVLTPKKQVAKTCKNYEKLANMHGVASVHFTVFNRFMIQVQFLSTSQCYAARDSRTPAGPNGPDQPWGLVSSPAPAAPYWVPWSWFGACCAWGCRWTLWQAPGCTRRAQTPQDGAPSLRAWPTQGPSPGEQPGLTVRDTSCLFNLLTNANAWLLVIFIDIGLVIKCNLSTQLWILFWKVYKR